jgi:hypothetical protein
VLAELVVTIIVDSTHPETVEQVLLDLIQHFTLQLLRAAVVEVEQINLLHLVLDFLEDLAEAAGHIMAALEQARSMVL